ncbi:MULTISPECIES: bifunctional methylenetetrahydrofolate dehydrogenase/methenyltetrahydrofolate cyclohydrolase FolD [unclassified Paludibacterium]|uniref:bifunctional methylenetetrahydrofolate dehydrogenase/methenyltetrahydrofolate cyclohydrolase FolD n=1 Tax=unclassified Paludibacterium TaxID=2618429 RepID=UPI001C047287|nr:bifunctional methylenetetrahydrofolate dehydrogenase/methenyltetrahydrofolate cyclohydrolase FolD [Paludibacterium sp. B53371]BEV71771.1 bifunctional methylenetetrahydrofolate dehydrogenase/methenyltetrahydrofolate cyclohydrolase FolD [Paludibacterium sp. THUN1379]
MAAQRIDGKAVAEQLIDQVRQGVEARRSAGKRVPGIAFVLVGDDPASASYVRGKKRACERTGIQSFGHDLPATVSQSELLALMDQLNADEQVDGILVQLPLPGHLDAETVLERIDPAKDVDGFHPYNIGRLAMKMPVLRPCTPRGVMTLLAHYRIEPAGKHAVVVGASNIVGRPMALELLLARATVTVCHSATTDLAAEVARADILVVAAGQPGLIRGEWVKPGAVVMDVGINYREDGSLCGDVDFVAASERAAFITPVPGGVGPMTIASLMQNTLDAASRRDPV